MSLKSIRCSSCRIHQFGDILPLQQFAASDGIPAWSTVRWSALAGLTVTDRMHHIKIIKINYFYLMTRAPVKSNPVSSMFLTYQSSQWLRHRFWGSHNDKVTSFWIVTLCSSWKSTHVLGEHIAFISRVEE
jgi:hypothetical protein